MKDFNYPDIPLPTLIFPHSPFNFDPTHSTFLLTIYCSSFQFYKKKNTSLKVVRVVRVVREKIKESRSVDKLGSERKKWRLRAEMKESVLNV